MELSERLRSLRREKGWSQEELADRIGVSRQALSKWESGQSVPELDKLVMLSELYGVSLDTLVKGEKGEDGESGRPVYNLPFWHWGLSYEYKSERTWRGMPLLHVNIGYGVKRARGVIAIGNFAKGIVAVGFVARGLVSLGLLSLGLVSIGVLSLGLLLGVGTISAGIFAIGAIALGIFALGAVSIGMFSVGACSVASHVAIGDYASGHVAVGRIAKGVKTIVDTSPNHDFSFIKADEVRAAIEGEFPHLWKWIVDLLTVFFRQ